MDRYVGMTTLILDYFHRHRLRNAIDMHVIITPLPKKLDRWTRLYFSDGYRRLCTTMLRSF